MSGILDLVLLLLAALLDRERLLAENLALRHQLGVLKRSVARPKIEDSDRIVLIMLRRLLTEWKDTLIFVKPDTVVRWHRKGFKYYWRRMSRSTPGRPPIGKGIVLLIRRMSEENVTWGAPRIRDELALLGHEVRETTVAKYMVKQRRKEQSQT